MEEVIVILAEWNFLPPTTSNLFLNSFLEHQLRQRNVPVVTADSHITAANLEDVQLLARFPRGRVCSIAAQRSDLQLFVEARRRGFILGNAAKYASRNGFIPIAKLALQDNLDLVYFEKALKYNHPDLVIELWDSNLKFTHDAYSRLLVAATKSTNSECFVRFGKFLANQDIDHSFFYRGASLTEICAHISDFQVFRVLTRVSASWKTSLVTKLAARRGDLKFLSWLRRKDCPWTHTTTKAAAKAGHLEVLQWAVANGCPLSDEALGSACKKGHFEVAEWLLQQPDAVRPSDILLKACQHSLAMVKLCLRYDVQWPTDENHLVVYDPSLSGAVVSAAQRCDSELLEWLHQQGLTKPSENRSGVESISAIAAIYGHFELAKQWYERGSELPQLDHVPRYKPGNLKFLEWLYQRGAEVDKGDFFLGIIISCDVEMLQWAMARGIVPDFDEVLEYDIEVDPQFKTLWCSNFIGDT